MSKTQRPGVHMPPAFFPSGFPFPPIPATITGMARTHYRTRLEAERMLPHRVDILVSGGGLGARLNQMHKWCRENLHAADWAQHGHTTRESGKMPQDYARFYFA